MAVDTYLCFFCSSDIRPTEETITLPSLGILVHKDCYDRDTSMREIADDDWRVAA
jgi:hypothetical protein